MQPITIQNIRISPVGMPLVEKLRTSTGSYEPFRSAIIIELTTTDGVIGWGECPTKMRPSYAYESMGTALHILSEFLVPYLRGKTLQHPTETAFHLREIRGHPMAKHSIEAAVWDALAKTNNLSLAQLFAQYAPEGSTPRDHVVVGVSIGIQESIESTLNIIDKRLAEGYSRIKLKIKPGWDVELARQVRAAYPDMTMMLDANSAYQLDDAPHLQSLDEFHLLMLEQPLGHDDIYEHSKLQPQLESAICLDESIKGVNDVRLAVEIGACRIINLKPARVGGFTESLAIYRYCVENKVPLWIGGLLETGIGRAANLAFAALPGVTLPSDISATNRYYDPDLTEPPFVLQEGSTLAVPSGPGIGVEVIEARLDEAALRWRQNNPYSMEMLKYVTRK
ncbi:MAG: o-succinylbenzoate synthase [Anaerolineae bacterium]